MDGLQRQPSTDATTAGGASETFHRESGSGRTTPRHQAPPGRQVHWQCADPPPDDPLALLDVQHRHVPLCDAHGRRGAIYENTLEGRRRVDHLQRCDPAARPHLFVAPRAKVTGRLANLLAEPLTRHAQLHLARQHADKSALRTVTLAQKAWLLGLACVFGGWALLAPVSLFLLLNALFALFYLSVGFARLVAVFTPLPRLIRYRRARALAGPETVPFYTVLVPIYDEASMVAPLVRALSALDYPADRLEIIILAEADDHPTLQALAALALPTQFCVVPVPPSQPRTKPKALAIGLRISRGTYVTIFDAEDRPEPNQLRLAAAAFAADDRQRRRRKGLGCVQAALHITNGSESFFTRHFALDYMALFDAFLPALSRFNLPIPLGGTSNHFRRSALLDAGGWDPFNVTEDADLGIRLARLGYSTQMIASTTYEEAPARFQPWLKQRARWFKGWWQTWLVHMRRPIRLMHELNLSGFLVFQTIMLGVLVSVLIHPFYLLATVWALSGAGGPLFDASTGTGQALISINIANFVLGYVAAAALIGAGAERRGVRGVVPAMLTIPLYWICLSVAGFVALWELIRRPHHWNKTPHGQTRR